MGLGDGGSAEVMGSRGGGPYPQPQFPYIGGSLTDGRTRHISHNRFILIFQKFLGFLVTMSKSSAHSLYGIYVLVDSY